MMIIVVMRIRSGCDTEDHFASATAIMMNGDAGAAKDDCCEEEQQGAENKLDDAS